MHRKTLGAASERKAAEALERKGYRIVARNFRCPLGEIDLVALDRRTVVFLEVRSVSGKRRGHPKESVSERKKRTLAKVALWYLKQKNWGDRSARFDVVTFFPEENGTYRMEHFENAFEM